MAVCCVPFLMLPTWVPVLSKLNLVITILMNTQRII